MAELVSALGEAGANLESRDAADVTERGLQMLEARDVLVHERGLWRVRDRLVLRYYARTISHLLEPPRRLARTH